jgi:hypothetical protein
MTVQLPPLICNRKDQWTPDYCRYCPERGCSYNPHYVDEEGLDKRGR